MNPVLQEAAIIGVAVTGSETEFVFPGRQGTDHAQERLRRHDRHDDEVGRAKVDVAYPVPPQEEAEPDRHEAKDYEGDDGEVDDEYDVRREGVKSRFGHFRDGPSKECQSALQSSVERQSKPGVSANRGTLSPRRENVSVVAFAEVRDVDR